MAETQQTPQAGQKVHRFQVRTPICHIVPVSRAYPPQPQPQISLLDCWGLLSEASPDMKVQKLGALICVVSTSILFKTWETDFLPLLVLTRGRRSTGYYQYW